MAYQFVYDKLPWHERIDKQLAKLKKKLSKEDYQGFYVRMRVKYAQKFDEMLVNESEELGELFKMIQEARAIKNNLDRQCMRANKQLAKTHSINYDVIYQYLEQYKNVSLRDIGLDKSNDGGMEKSIQPKRRASNLSDLSASDNLSVFGPENMLDFSGSRSSKGSRGWSPIGGLK